MSALVLPGDRLSLSSASLVKLGPGLVHAPAGGASSSSSGAGAAASSASTLGITRAGLLARTQGGKAEGRWVETNARRYIPSPGDSIIGQVTHRSADGYLLSLGSAHSATLPALAFEGATKRHRPNLRVGALVYARIVTAERHAEPEVTCVDPETGKAEGFGELKGDEGHAMCWRTSLGLARSLLRPTHPLLPALATHFPFEAAVGHNGLVWARAQEVKHLIAFGAVLRAADELLPSGLASGAGAAGAGKKKKKAQLQGEEEMDGAMLAENRGALPEAEVRRIVALYT